MRTIRINKSTSIELQDLWWYSPSTDFLFKHMPYPFNIWWSLNILEYVYMFISHLGFRVYRNGDFISKTNHHISCNKNFRPFWAICQKSLTWIFRPFWGPDSLTITTMKGDQFRLEQVVIICPETMAPFHRPRSSVPSKPCLRIASQRWKDPHAVIKRTWTSRWKLGNG